MTDLKIILDDTILAWGQVTEKFMFGSPCYLAAGKMFCIQYQDVIVLTCLGSDSRATLLENEENQIFTHGSKSIKSWIQIAITDERQLLELVPAIKESYANALKKA